MRASLRVEGECRLGAAIQHLYRIKGKAKTPEFYPVGGRFEDQVEVQIRSSTPGARIFYTTDGSQPTEDSHECHGHVLWDTIGQFTFKAIAARADLGTSESAMSELITVVPRPPRPAYDERTHEQYHKDMHAAYHKYAEQYPDGAMRPSDILNFALSSLNPDDGRCPTCMVTAEEKAFVQNLVDEFRAEEGLAEHQLESDDDIKIHHGFITRGDCEDFMVRLLPMMRKIRAEAGKSEL